MSEMIDDEPSEAREWLNSHPDWEFIGQMSRISHKSLLEFVNDLYEAGCHEILISEYIWEIEQAYKSEEFQPDMLIIKLPNDIDRRQRIFKITNESLPKLKRHTYKDSGSNSLWYLFEPEPHHITVGKKKITWYS